MRRGVMASVLDGFLGTYTSRNSEWRGYWLWGFLAAEGVRLECDVLQAAAGAAEDPAGYAHRLAAERFQEQCAKAGAEGWCERAAVVVTCAAAAERGTARAVFEMRFVARVEGAWGVVEKEVVLAVSPHDPAVELRSTR